MSPQIPKKPGDPSSSLDTKTFTRIRVQVEETIATITLDDPKTRNALGRDLCRELCDALGELGRREDVALVTIRSSGPAFCAGGNIKDMMAKQDIFAGEAAELAKSYRESIQKVPLALWALPQPSLAIIDGPAIGAGLDLACFCDLRVATRKAQFAESFGRLGLISGIGGAWALQRLIGLSYAKACELSLTGKTFNADEALAWGVIHQLSEADALEADLELLTHDLLAKGRHVLVATKALLRQGLAGDLESHLQLAAALQGGLQRREEHFEKLRSMSPATRS